MVDVPPILRGMDKHRVRAAHRRPRPKTRFPLLTRRPRETIPLQHLPRPRQTTNIRLPDHGRPHWHDPHPLPPRHVFTNPHAESLRLHRRPLRRPRLPLQLRHRYTLRRRRGHNSPSRPDSPPHRICLSSYGRDAQNHPRLERAQRRDAGLGPAVDGRDPVHAWKKGGVENGALCDEAEGWERFS